MQDVNQQVVVTEAAVVDEAAAIVSAAIRATVADSLRAATVCACHSCRARAVHMFQWADAMLPVTEREESEAALAVG